MQLFEVWTIKKSLNLKINISESTITALSYDFKWLRSIPNFQLLTSSDLEIKIFFYTEPYSFHFMKHIIFSDKLKYHAFNKTQSYSFQFCEKFHSLSHP